MNGILNDLDRHPETGIWCDWLKIGRDRLAVASNGALAVELRNPSTVRGELRIATVNEALARILERKP